MRYYTADPHFGHANIIDLCDRPFPSVEVMDRATTEAWQGVLTDGDVLYVLGDLGGSPTETDHVRSLLTECSVPVRWIEGNHDRDPWPDALEPLATCLGDRVQIRTGRSDPRDDQPVFLVLDHHPMSSWNRSFHGAVQLHGHVYNGLDNEGVQRFDVGIDSIGAEPVPESKIIEQALAIDPPKYTDV